MFKRMSIIVAVLVLLGGGGLAVPDAVRTVHAEDSTQKEAVRDQTATFAVAKMTCALCPITVKNAIANLPGVHSVIVDFEAKTATVVFDPAAVSLADIAAASAKAGYPAEPVPEGSG